MQNSSVRFSRSIRVQVIVIPTGQSFLMLVGAAMNEQGYDLLVFREYRNNAADQGAKWNVERAKWNVQGGTCKVESAKCKVQGARRKV